MNEIGPEAEIEEKFERLRMTSGVGVSSSFSEERSGQFSLRIHVFHNQEISIDRSKFTKETTKCSNSLLLLLLFLSARHRLFVFILFVLFCFSYNTRLLEFGAVPVPWITNLSFYNRLFFFNCRFFSRLESLDLWHTPNLTCKFEIQLRS